MTKDNARSKKLFSLLLAFSVIPLSVPVDFENRSRNERDTGRNEASRDVDIMDMVDIATEMTEHGPAVAEEIIVKYKGETNFRIEKLPHGKKVSDARYEHESRADIEYAEPNYIAHAFMVPNDPLYSFQWNFPKIGMPSAWDVATTAGSNVIVAVIDTGVAYENFTQAPKTYVLAPDLAGTTFVPGFDYINNDTHPNDDNGHGTHVTGTIAGTTNNSLGVAGIAFNAKIMPVKVLAANGSGSYAAIANGIRFAADNGAKVINMSLGGSAPSVTLESALQYAFNKGVTIVAASGNDSAGVVSYPAAYNNYVIAVGATRFDNAKAPYSNYGTALDIMAPGGDTSVDQNGDGYGDGILQQTFQGANLGAFNYYFFQGTSMATPHVVGVAALVIAKGNAVTPTAVRAALESSADDLGSAGRDNTFGYGLVDPAGALAWVAPPPSSDIQVFSDSFEVSEWNGLWVEDTQNDWSRSSQRAINGSFSAEVDGRTTDASLTTNILDLQGKTNATITFSWFIESSLDGGEYVAFDTSDGTTWTERARIRGNVDTENVWKNVTVTVASSSVPSLQLRFRGLMSGGDEDANVDNVKVVAF